MTDLIQVGIGGLAAAKLPNTIVTYALGSCVGICIYDSSARVGGLSHIMLPDSTIISHTPQQVNKFADLALNNLVKEMEALGARKIFMKAKIVGGAQMFAAMSNTAIANIGNRNVVAVKAALKLLKIPIIAEDTGKDYGRTLYLFLEDGSIKIKSGNRGEKLL